MSAAWWPWLGIVALGVFHGINPAMGWLFAVGLGLQRGRRDVVRRALWPIAIGHALAVGLALAAGLSAGSLLPHDSLGRVGGAVLVAWGVWHAWRGHRHDVRIGMRTSMAGLALWSFLMAGAHGAGVMLFPVLLALCGGSGAAAGAAAGTAAGTAAGIAAGPAGGTALAAGMTAGLAVALHGATMLAVTAAVALLVYDRVGVAFLRTRWVNLDWVWSGALVASGLAMWWLG